MLGAQFCRKSKNPTLSMDCKFFFLIGCQKEHCGERWLRAALHQAAFLFMSLSEQLGFGDTKTAFPGPDVPDKSFRLQAACVHRALSPRAGLRSHVRDQVAGGSAREPRVGSDRRPTCLGPSCISHRRPQSHQLIKLLSRLCDSE